MHGHDEQIRKEQKKVAWYGLAHVKDNNFVHQRTVDHIRKNEYDDIFVPLQMSETDDEHPAVSVIKKIAMWVSIIAGLALLLAATGFFIYTIVMSFLK